MLLQYLPLFNNVVSKDIYEFLFLLSIKLL